MEKSKEFKLHHKRLFNINLSSAADHFLLIQPSPCFLIDHVNVDKSNNNLLNHDNLVSYEVLKPQQDSVYAYVDSEFRMYTLDDMSVSIDINSSSSTTSGSIEVYDIPPLKYHEYVLINTSPNYTYQMNSSVLSDILINNVDYKTNRLNYSINSLNNDIGYVSTMKKFQNAGYNILEHAEKDSSFFSDRLFNLFMDKDFYFKIIKISNISTDINISVFVQQSITGIPKNTSILNALSN